MLPDLATDFGVSFDAAVDNSVSIQAALESGERVFTAPAGICTIANTVYPCSGTTTALSGRNGIRIVGRGSPFPRLGLFNSLGLAGTQFRWIGAAGGTMFEVNGPATGLDFENVALDANNLAATCLKLRSISAGEFPNLVCGNYTGVGLDIGTQPVAVISGQDGAQLSSVALLFRNLRAFSTNVGATGIKLDGYLGDGANTGRDPTRIVFTNTYIALNASGSIGLYLGFVDQVTFDGLVMSGLGTNDGTSRSIKFKPSVTNPGGGNFPQNVVFDGHIDIGQGLKIDVDTAGNTGGGHLGGGNILRNMTTFDQQVLPRDPASRYLRFDAVETGNPPNGGYWSQGGQNIIDRGFRNLLSNARFERASRGTSFSSPASGSYLVDGWQIFHDIGSSFTVSRQEFAAGHTDVPLWARYYLSFVLDGITATSIRLAQRIPIARRYSGRKTTLSAWIQGLGGTGAFSARVTQNFGTGGSPSSDVFNQAGESQTIVPFAIRPWTRVQWQIAMGSVSGKTFGSNGDDYVEVSIIFPVVYSNPHTINVALPQWELGIIDTAFETRPAKIDELISPFRPVIPIPSSRNLTLADSGQSFNNKGATSLVVCPLPPAKVGIRYTAYVTDADGFKFAANGSDVIRLGGSVISSAGGYVQSTTVGASLKLTCSDDGLWMADWFTPTWSAA